MTFLASLNLEPTYHSYCGFVSSPEFASSSQEIDLVMAGKKESEAKRLCTVQRFLPKGPLEVQDFVQRGKLAAFKFAWGNGRAETAGKRRRGTVQVVLEDLLHFTPDWKPHFKPWPHLKSATINIRRIGSTFVG